MIRLALRSLILGFIVSGFLASVSASAADLSAPVIVTASRVAQTADEALASVSVLTREDIERSQARDALSLLRALPGVDVVRTGAPGGQTSVFLRGSNSNHTLVLVDGVRVASSLSGQFNWANLDPALIERIEIVRGPRATLYGSDAIGGVIQIFTRQTQGANLAGELGAYRTRAAEAGFGIGDRVRFGVNGSYRNTRGFSATHPGAGFIYDPDRDGQTQSGINTRLATSIGSWADVELSGLSNTQNTDFDSGPQYSKADNRSGQARLRTHVGSWTQTLVFGRAADTLRSFEGFRTDLRSWRSQVDWQHDIDLGGGSLVTAGANYYDDDARNIDVATETITIREGIHNRAAYLNWLGRFGVTQTELGARVDDHSRFGSHLTGQGALGLALGRWRVRASYGTAFKAPDINQLFHPGVFINPPGAFFFSGNPDLQPEESRSAELGASVNLSPAHQIQIQTYYTNVEELIAFQGSNNQAINIGRANLRGVELEYRFQAGAWHFRGHGGLHKAVNEITDQDLLRRPRKKYGMTLEHRAADGTDLGAELVAASGHVDFDNINFGTLDTRRYAVLNVYGQFPLARDLRLEARIDNLFNKDYELASGYNTPGLSPYIGLRYTPGKRGS